MVAHRVSEHHFFLKESKVPVPLLWKRTQAQAHTHTYAHLFTYCFFQLIAETASVMHIRPGNKNNVPFIKTHTLTLVLFLSLSLTHTRTLTLVFALTHTAGR